jgi:phosphate transport system protein
MSSHYEETLERDAGRIRASIGRMRDLALRALRDSVQAFLDRDRARAYLVVLRDQHLDELEKEVDRLCLEFLVRQQPVAGLLRFAYVTIKINQDLERIGDYCESIARQSLKIAHLDLRLVHDQYIEMAGVSANMLNDAVTAFLNKDVSLARQAIRSESRSDRLRFSLNSEIPSLSQAGRIPLEALTPLLTIARRLERVSDQAENICEETIYMCTGEYAKHKGLDLFRVLFVDQDNSCLSQIAEVIGMSLDQTKFLFSSAGLHPAPIDSRTLDFLNSKGFQTGRLRSKSVEQIPNLDYHQVVVAFGNLPLLFKPPTKTVQLEWDVEDPRQTEGGAGKVQEAYERAFLYVDTHLRDLVQAILGTEIEPARII